MCPLLQRIPKMVLCRKDVFNRKEIGFYHITTRCVRQAFLLGKDFKSTSSNHHRKAWIEQWFQSLTEVMAIEICAYAIMDNHTHLILRNRPDWLDGMDDYEVATRLARLYPGYQCLSSLPTEAAPERVQEILEDRDGFAQGKEKLADISIFMARWEEAVARRANKEDGCTGRFWEGRFYCQRLLDPAAVLAATIYVELNPLRANIVDLPGFAQFTSLTNRLNLIKVTAGEFPEYLTRNSAIQEEFNWLETMELGRAKVNNIQLCDKFLPVDTIKYLRVLQYVVCKDSLVNNSQTGASVNGILVRLGVIPENWRQTAMEFEKSYKLFAGSPEKLTAIASAQKKRCIHGVSTANQVYLSN